ncbi:FAD-binding domain-containing protein [Gigaspora margarita]|uniref:FAD-binding domain-containing protein n=1 Tax=Gigaspora margarita TaxID=4874 RepID=A0A8H3X691_GIGMA|nr:FAD-binding domain-containing protein [Gigaspora margarita]
MKTAKIGAGNMLGNIYNQLNQAGFGYYSHKYSLAFDNIISIEMVNATGDILQVDSIINSDLYFALRGAVTYMELEFNKTNMNQVYQLFDTFNEVGPSLDDGIALKMSTKCNGMFINASNPISTKFIPQTFFDSVEALSKQPNKQAIKVLVDFVNNDVCSVLASFDLFCGAVNVNDSSSSFIYRDALYCIQIESDWKKTTLNILMK